MNYIHDLLNAVHNSKVLLAVIGSRWITALDAQGRKRLDNEDDWIRKEILEAFDHGVPIIPVLVGRLQPRLSAADLLPELARLANNQSRRLDTHSFDADLRALGDELARLVPSLVDSDQPGEASEPDADDGRGSTTLRAGDHARQQVGGANTIVNDARGSTMNTGSGPQLTGDGTINVEDGNRGVSARSSAPRASIRTTADECRCGVARQRRPRVKDKHRNRTPVQWPYVHRRLPSTTSAQGA